MNSTCRFCEQVRFTGPGGGLFGRFREREEAATPEAWMDALCAASAVRVCLGHGHPVGRGRHASPRSGLMGGGGDWWIAVERREGGARAWRPRWDLGNRDAPDRRIWRVTYGMLGAVQLRRAHDPVPGVRARLEASLTRIREFSLRHAGGAFAEEFGRALASLRTGARHGYHGDLAPDGVLPQPAADLLDACQSAWVFGGMGSWNDLAFAGAPEGEAVRVTLEHYDAVCDAIAAAANASAGDG